jgi:RNA polymerase sigma factor (sigma-70 family)
MNSTPINIQPPQSDRDELIRLHLPLAYRLAACYRGSGLGYTDLVRTAGAGLVKAAEDFDFDTEVAFRTFAAPVIAGELNLLLRDHAAAPHRPTSQPGDRRDRQLTHAQRRISDALSHGRRVRGLARLLAVDTDVVADALLVAAGRETVTLNLPVQRRGGRPVGRLHDASAAPAAA